MRYIFTTGSPAFMHRVIITNYELSITNYAYDAVQLASLLRIQPAFSTTQSTQLIFLTADNRLCEIAIALGLLTDNPNHYP